MSEEAPREVAERIVNSHLDEMMSPREYVTTRLAIIDAVSTAIEQARREEREKALIVVHEVAKRSTVGGPVALACLKIAEALQMARKESDEYIATNPK